MRNNIWKAGVLFFYVVLILSCSSRQEHGLKLYAVDSFLSAQARYLSNNKAILHKSSRLGDVQDEVFITPKDSAAWKKELEIFAALDIVNKPLNRDLYRLERHADGKSNLMVKSITSSADLPVQYLRVYYQQTPDKLRKIEAEYNESNSLYNSVRVLTMEFQQVGSKPVLTSYSIEGGQKMFMGDSVVYGISGKLTLSK